MPIIIRYARFVSIDSALQSLFELYLVSLKEEAAECDLARTFSVVFLIISSIGVATL